MCENMRYEVCLKSVAQPKPQIQRLKTQKPLDPKKPETQRTQDLKDHKLTIRISKCKNKIGSEKNHDISKIQNTYDL